MQGLKENIRLADYTTIKLGGNAMYFCDSYNIGQIKECLQFVKGNSLKAYVLGGGSNTIFPDEGVNGIVIRVKTPGIEMEDAENGETIVTAQAGESWDELVRYSIDNDLAGLECLSGIPGYVGAVPIQNVGAYGQEVKDTIVSIKALERETLAVKEFTNEECRFAYRQSRFKNEDKDKYIITEVRFKLKLFGEPEIKYPELKKLIDDRLDLNTLKKGREKLTAVRNSVIEIRKRKSMVIDPQDPDSISCGSFFMNPIVSQETFEDLKKTYPAIPSFIADEGMKIPAAWLVETAGFEKGYTLNGAGISTKHTLALVNRGGRSKDLLNLAQEITAKVNEKFGLTLHKEPVVIC